MAEQFEKDTGIEVEYISLGGGDAVARVQAEMSNPQADFLVGGSVDLVRLSGGGRGAAGIRLPQQR